MVVCTAGNKVEALIKQSLCKNTCIFHNAMLISLELRSESLAEANCLSGDNVHQGAALNTGEYSLVYLLCELLVICEYKTAARSAESLMCGCGNNVGIRNGRGVLTCCNKSRDVCHIYHKIRTYGMSYLCHLLKINGSGVCGSTCYDKLRLVLLGELFVLLHINVFGFGMKLIRDEIVVHTRNVYGASVGEVTAVSKTHSHNGITGLKKGEVHSSVCLRSAVRLNVCVLCSKKLLGTFNSNSFCNVNTGAAAVISLSGVALGIFIGKYRAHSTHNRLGNHVF